MTISDYIANIPCEERETETERERERERGGDGGRGEQGRNKGGNPSEAG